MKGKRSKDARKKEQEEMNSLILLFSVLCVIPGLVQSMLAPLKMKTAL